MHTTFDRILVWYTFFVTSIAFLFLAMSTFVILGTCCLLCCPNDKQKKQDDPSSNSEEVKNTSVEEDHESVVEQPV